MISSRHYKTHVCGEKKDQGNIYYSFTRANGEMREKVWNAVSIIIRDYKHILHKDKREKEQGVKSQK